MIAVIPGFKIVYVVLKLTYLGQLSLEVFSSFFALQLSDFLGCFQSNCARWSLAEETDISVSVSCAERGILCANECIF